MQNRFWIIKNMSYETHEKKKKTNFVLNGDCKIKFEPNFQPRLNIGWLFFFLFLLVSYKCKISKYFKLVFYHLKFALEIL